MMYAIVDIETTGGYASPTGITEPPCSYTMAPVSKAFQSTHSIPQRDIPATYAALTSISNEMVENTPSSSESRIGIQLPGTVFVAHNVNFDYSTSAIIPKSNRVYDLTGKNSVPSSWKQHYCSPYTLRSLGNLCRSLKIDVEHRLAGRVATRGRIEALGSAYRRGAGAYRPDAAEKHRSSNGCRLTSDKAIDKLPGRFGA